MVIVVMGVSGSGKTSVGQALARHLGCPFYDGDDFHRPEQIAKMAAGIPLDDHDRAPWLTDLHDLLHQHQAQGKMVVLACSALKKQYRDQLQAGNTPIHFVYLHGSFELIQKRMASRPGHYMNPALLQSQFETLEAPGRDEAIFMDITPNIDQITTAILHQLNLSP